MPNWLNEFLYILALSKKTQLAIMLGCFFFFGIHIIGWYLLENFELHGPAKELQDIIAQKMANKYDKVAYVALFSFWYLAYKCYQKDKKRLW